MFTHLKVRTGMFGVLVVFVVALLAASLNGWYGARVSDQQIRDLNLLTAVQLDKLNNAAIWAVRASATSHSSLIDRMSNKIEAADQGVIAAKERLANGQKLVDEILPTVSDPQLLGAARDLQAVFTSYGQTVLRQIDSTRSGDLAEYVRINDEAKATSQAYAKARETFTNLITAKARQTMVESEQRIALAQFSALALVALTVLLAIGCWWFISQRVLAPLRDAAHHFEVIAAGDLSQPIHVASRNEIGQLFAALAHMQQSQRETLDHLSKTATQVSNAARDLGVVTRDGNLGLQQQNAELEQAASAVTEMTAAVEEVARNAVSTSQAASASDKLATASREQVRKVLGEIGTMSDDVQTTGSTIQRLADQANNIGKVLDVIRSVSEQTNLLALNAAIEAARAGEAGRGFAVVADEVRTLAHRTQQSTLEIEEMIASIQTSTGSAVSSIELSNQRASSTLQATRTSGEMLEEIFTAIGEINERNLVIASAAEEQAQVAREVDRNLLNIRELSSQAGLGADRTSTASQELSRLASEMMSIASRFKT